MRSEPTADSLSPVVASWIAGGVLLLAMVAASARSAVRLPADARIPVHYGSPERCYLASKRAGLLIWPAIGAVLFGALVGVAGSGLASDWVPGLRATLAPAALVVALGFQAGALVLARREAEAGRVTRDRSD